jgi:hypothetical protein
MPQIHHRFERRFIQRLMYTETVNNILKPQKTRCNSKPDANGKEDKLAKLIL